SCIIRLGKTPHDFQRRFFSNVIQGRDVVLDVGTGSGKSLCIDLPVLSKKDDIVLVVSPLSALIIEQVFLNRISDCSLTEMLNHLGSSFSTLVHCHMQRDAGPAQRIFVSPEIAASLEFSKKVLSQPRF
ncbi:hypothetical protein B0H19DRAFT_1334686, partial [Mycena capillaripes]